LGQCEAQAIPDDHPVIPQLNDLFGEHTFFLDPGTSGAFFHSLCIGGYRTRRQVRRW
jgi:hypothetical protein